MDGSWHWWPFRCFQFFLWRHILRCDCRITCRITCVKRMASLLKLHVNRLRRSGLLLRFAERALCMPNLLRVLTHLFEMQCSRLRKAPWYVPRVFDFDSSTIHSVKALL